MKILMLVSSFDRGGIGNIISSLSKHLVKRGLDITVGALIFEHEPPNGVKKLTLNSKLKTNPWKLASLFNNYDIIHAHQSSAVNYSIPFVKTRSILHYWGVSPKESFTRIRALNEDFSIWLALKHFNHIIAPSQYAKEVLRRKYNRWRDVSVVYCGVDTEEFNRSVPKKNLMGNPNFLYAGRLTRYKNVEELLMAMKLVVKLLPEAHLWVVGSGDRATHLLSLTKKLSLEENVSFTGWIPYHELPNYFSSCDVYVSASRWEMFGLPLIEAMACGKPIVASNCHSHTELVSRSGAGALYPLGDKHTLANTMIQVSRNAEQYCERAEQFAKLHEWRIIAKQVHQIYDICV